MKSNKTLLLEKLTRPFKKVITVLYVGRNAWQTTNEVAKDAGVSWVTALKYLNLLYEMDYLSMKKKTIKLSKPPSEEEITRVTHLGRMGKEALGKTRGGTYMETKPYWRLKHRTYWKLRND